MREEITGWSDKWQDLYVDLFDFYAKDCGVEVDRAQLLAFEQCKLMKKRRKEGWSWRKIDEFWSYLPPPLSRSSLD